MTDPPEGHVQPDWVAQARPTRPDPPSGADEGMGPPQTSEPSRLLPPPGVSKPFSARGSAARQVREEIAQFVGENTAGIIDRLWQLSEATKLVYVACPHCGKRSEVEVPDTASAVKAIEALMAQGYGRPTPEVEVRDRSVTVVRRVVAPGVVVDRDSGDESDA